MMICIGKKKKDDISIFGSFLFKEYQLSLLTQCFLISQHLYFLSDEFNLSNGLKLYCQVGLLIEKQIRGRVM